MTGTHSASRPDGRHRGPLRVVGTLLVLGLLAGLIVAALNVTLLVVRTGSMAPSIPAGSLALSRPVPVTDLQVGDVVSVRHPSTGDRITHRFVGVVPDGILLKGDTNAAADPTPYPVVAVDRVVGSLPYAGYLVSAAAAPWGLATIGMLGVAGTVVWLRSRGPLSRGSRWRPAVATATGLLVLTALVAPQAEGTSASWSDTASVTSGAFSVASSTADYCIAMKRNAAGVLVEEAGVSCAIPSVSCSESWITGMNARVVFTTTATGWDPTRVLFFQTNLRTKGCNPSLWLGWSDAATLTPADPLALTSACSALPVLAGSSSQAYLANQGGTVNVALTSVRSWTATSSITCVL